MVNILYFLYKKWIFLLQNNIFMLNLSILFFYVKKDMETKVVTNKLIKQITYLLPWSAVAFTHVIYAQTEMLDEIVVSGAQPHLAGSAIEHYQAISNQVIKKERLQKQSATLGNALAGELGVHSNPFGGGASAPIIRGQEGVRIKILQNGLDVVDMSAISPDHAVAADSLLAEQVELVRGASTLLYSSASAAGVVNVVDKRIPTAVPEKGYEGEIFTRFDTASQESTGTAGITFRLHPHLALRLEGLKRYSTHYRVPAFKSGGETIRYLPDSHNRSQVGTIGVSWIKDQSYLGVSYSERRDRYGLPGHNHKYDRCKSHVVDEAARPELGKGYLTPYPHLADDTDIVFAHLDGCIGGIDNDPSHSHDHPFGHEHEHSHGGPWVRLHSRRFDLRGQWDSPTAWLDKVKGSFSYADYIHYEYHSGQAGMDKFDRDSFIERERKKAEKNRGKAAGIYKNSGYNGKLEFYHTPIVGLSGVFGVQYSEYKTAILAPLGSGIKHQHHLVPNTQKQASFFAVENYVVDDFIFEVGARVDKQRIPIKYDQHVLNAHKKEGDHPPDLSTHKEKAVSYLGSVDWLFHPNYRLGLTLSRNERLPTPMELYYHGQHLATNSFEHGNKNLRKESSNNIELGFAYHTDKWDYKLSLYQNKFRNYIYNEDLARYGNAFLRRYTQARAKFHGIEAELNFRPTPDYQVTLFGDYVRGRLFDLPEQYGQRFYQGYIAYDEEGLIQANWEKQPYRIEGIKRNERDAPRVPPARLGMRLSGNVTEHLSFFADYTYVFSQQKTASSLSIKPPRALEASDFIDDDTGENLLLKGIDRDKYNRTGQAIADLSDSDKADFESALEAIRLREENEKLPAKIEKIQEDPSKGHHLLNIGVNYQRQIGHLDYSVGFSVNNVLNQRVYVHTSYLPYVPQMGRNYVLNFGVKF
ncbi:TonB-dependent receptor domain-containing protein [Pasteurella multocida]